jgi:hypothetical protein
MDKQSSNDKSKPLIRYECMCCDYIDYVYFSNNYSDSNNYSSELRVCPQFVEE